jgi:hypothetical protein
VTTPATPSTKTILVFGPKQFKINVPIGAKITFGPWSPSTGEGKYQMSEKALNGTLRIYENAKSGASILGVFSGVTGFRDLTMGYAEEVAREEGAILWKSDEDGYQREEKVNRKSSWITPRLAAGADESED